MILKPNDSVYLPILTAALKLECAQNNRNLKFLESQREAPPIEYTDFGVER